MASSAPPLKFPIYLPSSTKKRREFVDLPTIDQAGRSRRPSTVVVAGINGHPQIYGSGALRVAFQGAPGAYSEFAAKTACQACTTVPCRAFADAIAAVESGRADRAILPVESTMEGTALRNYDLLLRHDLRIVQEINLFVHYCLLAMPGVRPGELRRVISHPMALAHCGRALSPLGLRREPIEDTTSAVEMLRSNHLLDTAVAIFVGSSALHAVMSLRDAHGQDGRLPCLPPPSLPSLVLLASVPL